MQEALDSALAHVFKGVFTSESGNKSARLSSPSKKDAPARLVDSELQELIEKTSRASSSAVITVCHEAFEKKHNALSERVTQQDQKLNYRVLCTPPERRNEI